MRSNLLMIVLCVLGGVGPNIAMPQASPGKPAVTLVIEHDEILAGQSVGLHVWIENPTDAQLQDVRFGYAGPRFLHIGTYQSSGNPATCTINPGGVIRLDPIQPRSTQGAPLPLCLQADPAVDERDASLAFSTSYTVLQNGQSKPGVVVVEKKLSVGLFGTESVGGVSLRLAAYVMPGVLFMMILRLGGFPLVDKLGAPEVAALSVLGSILLFPVAAVVSRINLTFEGIASAVSATLFVALCVIAAVISLAMVAIHRLCEARRLRKQKELLVELTDNDATALQKALRQASTDPLPVTVITNQQKRYVGSLMAPTSSGGVALLGWFQLRTEDVSLRAKLDGLIKKNLYLDALQLAHDNRIEPEMRNWVRTLSPEGTLEFTNDTGRRFRRGEVMESSIGAVEGLENERPLELSTP